MNIERLRSLLDAADEAAAWLRPLGVEDVRSGHRNLVSMASAGVPLDLLGGMCDQFAAAAAELPDPGMALNNLERYMVAARSPMSTAALFERDADALPNLLVMLSSSQARSDQLCLDPESFDHLRVTAGRPVAREVLIGELVAETRAVRSMDEVMAALRRFKRREILRIAYGDVVEGHLVAQVTRQISYVADAVVEAALDGVWRFVGPKLGENGAARRQPRIAVLALGKLGGLELNYSSDIDLTVLYDDAAGSEAQPRGGGLEIATRVARELIRVLGESTELGFAYRVDMRLRPDGKQGPLASRVDQALAYYDTRGRTWERQAYVKARPIAGDLELGQTFLDQLEPWIYRRYLSLADITGIKALKRKIEKRAEDEGVANRNVKTGRGGIRDIEFVIQFLQLLNGASAPGLRTTNTLEAIVRLEEAGCLNHSERRILEENYAFLRKVEHRLQIMYDLQTHELPQSGEELAKLARRLSRAATPHVPLLASFQADFAERTQLNRRILDHLLHDAFREDPTTEPEVDLVNDPDPDPATIQRVLSRYPFREPLAAYEHLMSLAREGIPFLSTRRCRMFLAAIAPRLLAAIAKTPDPDSTLVTLCRVSDSLGGKAALWELFSRNRPSLDLFVTLCAACPYLAGILTSNPGMIDELIDSLIVERLPELKRLQADLDELTRGAEDVEPILHSFKHAEHLRVGVRDIVGRDDIQQTHAALADVAETCLTRIIRIQHERLALKFGRPILGEQACLEGDPPWAPPPAAAGQPCELIVLALGKLGGREPNYHSDLDLVFLYEGEGVTRSGGRGNGESTTNAHFFSQLAQRIIVAVNQFGPYGRLYEVDARLRPTGRNGPLAVPIAEFVRYFREGGGQLWERLALCKARVLLAAPAAARRAEAAVLEATFCRPWTAGDALEIAAMRRKLEESASPQNLKRGLGGTMDVEFVAQMLQLKYGREFPAVRQSGTLDALEALRAERLLESDDARQLIRGYRFLRSVEARIRLMDSAGRHEFPLGGVELEKLALLLGYADPTLLKGEVATTFCSNRSIFDRVFQQHARGG